MKEYIQEMDKQINLNKSFVSKQNYIKFAHFRYINLYVYFCLQVASFYVLAIVEI